MKAKHKPKRVLLFVTGIPSAHDKAVARLAGILLRDPRAYRAGDFVEACDVVAGDAPPAYRERYDLLSPDDLAEIVRPFVPEALENPIEHGGQPVAGEGGQAPVDESASQAPPAESESNTIADEATEEGKATVEGLKAALDAKQIPYSKTAKKAELQALLAAAA